MAVAVYDAYLGNRSGERYRYQRLVWPSMEVIGEYGDVTDGSVDFADGSSVKATCEFSFVGKELPGSNEMVRIIHAFETDDGAEHESVVGTFIITLGDCDVMATSGGIVYKGHVSGSSVLIAAENKRTKFPIAFSSSSTAEEYAIALLGQCGVRLAGVGSAYRIAEQHVFDSNSSYLEMANWLLDQAALEMRIDRFGGAYVAHKVQKGGGTPLFRFDGGQGSIIGHVVTETRSSASKPNVVSAVYSSDSMCLWGSARNDAGSINSVTAMGGREVCETVQVSSVSKDLTTDQIIEELKDEALRRLIDYGTDTTVVSFTNEYVPVTIGDTVLVECDGGGESRSWNAYIDNMRVSLKPGGTCTTECKSSAAARIEYTLDGGNLWEQ